MKAVKIIIGVFIILAVGGGSFYFGMKYGREQAAKLLGRRTYEQLGGSANIPVKENPGVVSGELMTIGDKILVLKTIDGRTKQVSITGETRIRTLSEISLSDLQVGKTLSITGGPNQDGTFSAVGIQVLTGSSSSSQKGLPRSSVPSYGSNPPATTTGTPKASTTSSAQ